ncbi:GFA family protein [Luminiphilus sp. nBUS_16]|uniref:GFA family protein n=1 Tax=Luminiphilus sp. nBUS_16 TaxID=3395315 RepID=UPI003EB95663
MAENGNGSVLVTHEGGCHCGKVQWQIQAPAHLQTHTCNCSICNINHYQHLIVPKQRFQLLSDPDTLSEYRFGSGLAKHYFCKACGVKSFYRPRSNPDGVSVHARCLNPASVLSITDTPFDGQNWEKNAASLAHLSKA